MIAAVCAILSGLAFYFSIGLGEQWALAWIAPIPVLWLAFGEHAAWRTFAAMRVALIGSNETVGDVRHDDETSALRTINAYAAEANRLASARPDLIVLPEDLARIARAWRATAQTPLAAVARQSGATIVAGFNTTEGGAQRNVAWGFVREAAPVTYEKRRLVLGLESPIYTPGDQARVLSNGVGLEICKDMDFHNMIRGDIAANHPLLLAVPAWDFGADGWAHARIAILRSVENGVPMARSARAGWLTLNGRYGRVIGRMQVGLDFRRLWAMCRFMDAAEQLCTA